jgi:PAS domain-containing protein
MKYADSIRRAGRYSQRYRVVHPDGLTRWIHSQWEVKNGVHGVPDRALGIMMDDTEAYEAARALVDASAQLQMAVALGRIAIWRHDLRTQRMVYNDRAFEVLGMTPRPEGFTIEEVRSFIHPTTFRSSSPPPNAPCSRTSPPTWRLATDVPTAAGATCSPVASSSAAARASRSPFWAWPST